MKKIEFITGTCTIATLVITTPIVATSCYNNDPKLNIKLVSNEVDVGARVIAAYLKYDNGDNEVFKEVSVESSDLNVLNIIKSSITPYGTVNIDVIGLKKGVVNLKIKATNYGNNTVQNDFKIVVNGPDTKVAEIDSITWIDENETEVSIPIIGVTYAISEAKIIYDDDELDFELLKSIKDNGSDTTLEVEEIVEPITGLSTVFMTPTSLGEHELRLKFEFYKN